jgi:hypothetical protein
MLKCVRIGQGRGRARAGHTPNRILQCGFSVLAVAFTHMQMHCVYVMSFAFLFSLSIFFLCRCRSRCFSLSLSPPSASLPTLSFFFFSSPFLLDQFLVFAVPVLSPSSKPSRAREIAQDMSYVQGSWAGGCSAKGRHAHHGVGALWRAVIRPRRSTRPN